MSISHPLLNIIPIEEQKIVYAQYGCELDFEFMGFTDAYKSLAGVIPIHFTILDLGCNLAAQSYYFSSHKKYVGVDVIDLVRFSPTNATHHICKIQDYILLNPDNLDLATTFAICSYVPDKQATKLARDTYPNIFAYYPCK